MSALKDGGWFLAAALFITTVFGSAIKDALRKGIDKVGSFAYQRLAGSRLLRRRALGNYRRGLREYTERINVPFRPNRPLLLRRIYVSLRVAGDGAEKPREAWDLLEEHSRVVVTGPPGAGKSMLLRHLAASESERDDQEKRHLPVLVELHRLVHPAQGGDSMEDYLVDAFARYGFPRAEKFIHTALEKNWLLLLLDGLDEVPATERNSVAAKVRSFLEVRSCSAVLTCRSAVYHGEFDSIADQHVELEPFEDQQIQSFLDSWSDPMPAGKSPAQLMAALREQPQLFLAARNPLLLTIITHLYSDNPTYVLPRSRAEFYRQAAAILLEQWQGHLRQNQFDAGEKRTVLSGLALRMQEIVRDGDHDRRTISQEEAFECASELMPKIGREASQVGGIMREIVERSGLLLSIDGGTRFSFAHLTFQEYFAAEALINQSQLVVERFRSDRDTWREVVILWCGLVTDCTSMVEEVTLIDRDVALSCVAEARSLDDAVARRVLDPVIEQVASGAASEDLQKSLGGVAADIRPRGNRVLKALIQAFEEAGDKTGMLAIGVALSASNRSEATAPIVARLKEDERLEGCLVRMGDLAVPALKEAASAGSHRAVCAVLASIGTPEAGVVLASVMWQNRKLAKAAAWGVAQVVGNPLVARRLSEAQDFRMVRDDVPFAWIWRPFSPPGDPVLPRIVGKAAGLIKETTDDADAIATPDSRISVALCAQESNPLAEAIRPDSTGRRLVSKANEVMKAYKVRFDNDGSLMAFNEQGESAAGREVAMNLAARRYQIVTYGDLMELVMVEAGEGPIYGWWAQPSGLSPLGEEAGAASRRWDAFINCFVDNVDDKESWVRLVRRMPSRVRRSFMTRMSRRGTVTPDNWPEVRQDTPYRYEGSAWYATVLTLAAVVSIVALWQGFGILWSEGISGEGIFALISCASIVGSWIWMRQSKNPVAIAGISPYRVSLTIWALVGLAFSFSDRSLLGISLMAGAVTPGCIWLVGSALADELGLLGAIGILIGLGAMGLLCASLGERKERARMMPLVGFFVDDVLDDRDLAVAT